MSQDNAGSGRRFRRTRFRQKGCTMFSFYAQFTPRLLATGIFISLAFLSASMPARAVEGIVIGDSIGQDLANTVGVRTIAKTSISFLRRTVHPQIARIPRNAIVVISLGLNDGASHFRYLKPYIEKVILAIERKGQRSVWIGPPCVFKRWDKTVKLLDSYLALRLSRSAIQYVSLRDTKICRRSMRSRDGEHFTPRGYHYVWNKMRMESSYARLIKTRN